MDRSQSPIRWRTAAVFLPVIVGALGVASCGSDNETVMNSGYAQTNLVSDQAGVAPVTDANLVNAWGLARSATSPWWVADNHTGVSTLYNGAGQPFPSPTPLVVTIPPPPNSPLGAVSAPTGLIFNATAGFVVGTGTASGPAVFIFDTEDGTISGWSPMANPTEAILVVDDSDSGAIYKGLASGSNAGGNFIYTTDFHNGSVDAYDSTFAEVELAGDFSDPSIPSGFAPFGIHNLNNSLYVTYAKQDENKEDDVAGPGNGYVNVFDTNGHRLSRFASQGTLNSPWGVVLAPLNFGPFSGAVLIGNFGDGRINAFSASGAFLGQLATLSDTPITISGLWALGFGNGANAGSTTTLFFTAGPNDEEHGLFGMITAVTS
jgi:uncharacterized protein (TIGR03118 family)